MSESNDTFTAADDDLLDTQELVSMTYQDVCGRLMSTCSNAGGAEVDPPHLPDSDHMHSDEFENAPILT